MLRLFRLRFSGDRSLTALAGMYALTLFGLLAIFEAWPSLAVFSRNDDVPTTWLVIFSSLPYPLSLDWPARSPTDTHCLGRCRYRPEPQNTSARIMLRGQIFQSRFFAAIAVHTLETLSSLPPCKCRHLLPNFHLTAPLIPTISSSSPKALPGRNRAEARWTASGPGLRRRRRPAG
jgi:hypothetical protein